MGRDPNSLDWSYDEEQRFRFQGSILEQSDVSLLRALNYTDYCVLTDLDMRVGGGAMGGSTAAEFNLTPVSASEVVIGNVADKFKLPCQRVHAVTVTVCRRPDSNWRCMADAGFESN